MQVYTGLILAGLSVSFLHAILPTHWLPFVLAGRAQHWSMGRTLTITVIAGGGHVLMTTLLGVIIVWTGVALTAYIEEWAAILTSAILGLFGLYYIINHLRGGGHHHHHHIPGLGAHAHLHEAVEESIHDTEPTHSSGDDHEHSHHDHAGHDHAGHEQGATKRFSPDTVAVGSLIALLTFSPCEGFLPIYLSALPYGWWAFATLAAVLSIGTLSGMILFTGLTFAGIRRLDLAWLERYEGLILGGVLMLLAGVVILFHH